jgi:hypothetical protein
MRFVRLKGVLGTSALSLGLVTTGGCSLLVSTDGLANRATAEAGVDAISPDGSVPDTSTDADAAPPAPKRCTDLKPKPRYCADFDVGVLTDFGRANGTPALDTSVAVSTPRSLLAVVETTATGARQAALVKDFPDAPTAFDLSFDAYVASYDVTHDVEVVNVTFDKGMGLQQRCLLTVSIRSGSWSFDESCVNGAATLVNIAHDTTVRSRLARWTHVSLSVSFVAPRTYSVKIDDEAVFTAKPLDPATFSANASLVMGVVYLQAAATMRARINLDNVVFDYR